MKNPINIIFNNVLFLGQDVLINVGNGYVHSPENFEFIDGILILLDA
jgi:histidinol phosphatase-like enzyme